MNVHRRSIINQLVNYRCLYDVTDLNCDQHLPLMTEVEHYRLSECSSNGAYAAALRDASLQNT